MGSKRLWALFSVSLLVLGAAVVWGLFAREVNRPNAAVRDFPPLVMIWRDAANYGLNGAAGHQIFRLDYIDRCHQRMTLLEHSALPGIAGLYTQFDGQTKTTHDPAQGRDDAVTIEPSDCWPPDRYLLIPIAFENPQELAKRPGWVQRPAADGLMLVSYDGTVVVASGSVPEHIDITYQPTDGLPIRVVHVINGKEVQRREVLELHIGT